MSEEPQTLSRLQRLEADVAELRSTQSEIFVMIREVREGQIRMEAQLKFGMCPAPGSCLLLRTEMEEVKIKTAKHEEYVQQAKGASWVTKILWALLGVAGTAAMGEWFFHRKP